MEKLLVSILLISILSLASLFLITNVQKISINEIKKTKLNEKVVVKGSVTKFVPREKVNFIQIDNSTLQIVYFEKIDLKVGDLIEIKGELKLYKGKLEILARKIKKV